MLVFFVSYRMFVLVCKRHLVVMRMVSAIRMTMVGDCQFNLMAMRLGLMSMDICNEYIY